MVWSHVKGRPAPGQVTRFEVFLIVRARERRVVEVEVSLGSEICSGYDEMGYSDPRESGG